MTRAGYRGPSSWSGRGARPRWWHDVALAAVVAAAIAAGIWLGEDATWSPSSAVALLTAGVVVAAGAGRAAAPNVARGRRGAMVAAAAFGLAFWAGTREVQTALSECGGRGADLRTELARYRAVAGVYPDRLTQLVPRAGPLPCRRLLRGTLLSYRRTITGYQLSYDGWLASRQATETAPFGSER